MTELQILQDQVKYLKEVIEIQNKLLEALKTQPQVQIQYVPYYVPYQHYQYPYYQYPYYQQPYIYWQTYGAQGIGGPSIYGQQQNAINAQQGQMYANQNCGLLAAGAYNDGGQQVSGQQFSLGNILSLAK